LKLKHWVVFLLLGAIWSSSFMWIKIAVQEIGPITLVAFRVLFGLLFGVAVIFIQRVQLPRSLKEWFPPLVLGITNVAVPFFLISWGQQSIDSAVAAILDATVPLFTILIAHYLLRDDKMTWPKVLGLLLGLAGVVVLMSKDIGASLGSVLGQLAVIAACVFYAGSAVYARKTRRRRGHRTQRRTLLSATAVMWLAAFLVESPWRFRSWASHGFPALPGHPWLRLAFIMLYYLNHEIGPTRTSMVTYLFPLGGVTLGVAFLNEQLSWQLVVGAVLIILSLVVANLQPQKQERNMEEQAAAN
jgi:drug/metabolite transporter (DMT)-like permease